MRIWLIHLPVSLPIINTAEHFIPSLEPTWRTIAWLYIKTKSNVADAWVGVILLILSYRNRISRINLQSWETRKYIISVCVWVWGILESILQSALHVARGILHNLSTAYFCRTSYRNRNTILDVLLCTYPHVETLRLPPGDDIWMEESSFLSVSRRQNTSSI